MELLQHTEIVSLAAGYMTRRCHPVLESTSATSILFSLLLELAQKLMDSPRNHQSVLFHIIMHATLKA